MKNFFMHLTVWNLFILGPCATMALNLKEDKGKQLVFIKIILE